MKASTEQRIIEHGRQLLAIFPNAIERDPVELCRKLRRLESTAHKAAEDYCNVQDFDWESASAKHAAKVAKLLGDDRVWVNGDPRGYALKIDLAPGEKLYSDWGGYGIIAPDLSAD